MGRFVRGDVVVVPSFSVFGLERRPALVLAELSGDDVILCQITSQVKADGYSVPITSADFTSGKLNQDSNVRPNRLFTADSNIVVYRAGELQESKVDEVVTKVIELLRA